MCPDAASTHPITLMHCSAVRPPSEESLSNSHATQRNTSIIGELDDHPIDEPRNASQRCFTTETRRGTHCLLCRVNSLSFAFADAHAQEFFRLRVVHELPFPVQRRDKTVNTC
jgi:hypothetical protein